MTRITAEVSNALVLNQVSLSSQDKTSRVESSRAEPSPVESSRFKSSQVYFTDCSNYDWSMVESKNGRFGKKNTKRKRKMNIFIDFL